jgi:alcohol dehydrogenase (cytochrome c)
MSRPRASTKPVDYDSNKAIQTYAGVGNLNPSEPLKKVCPSALGGNNYWPSSYSPSTRLLYIPALTGCMNIGIDLAKHNAARGWNGGSATGNERFESNLTAIDPITQEIKRNTHLRYPNFSGALATGGGLVFLGLFDGTVAAFDATTLDELWKVNVGSGFNAPPMTFEVNGQQYLAIASGLSPMSRRTMSNFGNLPELTEQRNATLLFCLRIVKVNARIDADPRRNHFVAPLSIGKLRSMCVGGHVEGATQWSRPPGEKPYWVTHRLRQTHC